MTTLFECYQSHWTECSAIWFGLVLTDVPQVGYILSNSGVRRRVSQWEVPAFSHHTLTEAHSPELSTLFQNTLKEYHSTLKPSTLCQKLAQLIKLFWYIMSTSCKTQVSDVGGGGGRWRKSNGGDTVRMRWQGNHRGTLTRSKFPRHSRSSCLGEISQTWQLSWGSRSIIVAPWQGELASSQDLKWDRAGAWGRSCKHDNWTWEGC